MPKYFAISRPTRFVYGIQKYAQSWNDYPKPRNVPAIDRLAFGEIDAAVIIPATVQDEYGLIPADPLECAIVTHAAYISTKWTASEMLDELDSVDMRYSPLDWIELAKARESNPQAFAAIVAALYPQK